MTTSHLTIVTISTVNRQLSDPIRGPDGNTVVEEIVSDDTGPEQIYKVEAPPLVIFTPAWRKHSAPLRRQGTYFTGSISQGSGKAIWLFFQDGLIVSVVKNDNLPPDMDSSEKCIANWPLKLFASDFGVVTRALLVDGRELLGKWEYAVVLFRKAMKGTPNFWKPLEDMEEFRPNEIDDIKAIAEREYAKHNPLDPNGLQVIPRTQDTPTAPPTTTTPRGAPAKQDSVAKNIFRRQGKKGDCWKVIFQGQRLDPVPHLSGMTYIRILLAQPQRSIPAIDLYNGENPPPPLSEEDEMRGLDLQRISDNHGKCGKPDPLVTPAILRKINAERHSLAKQIESKDLTMEEMEEEQEKLEKIDKYLKNCRVASSTGAANFEPAENKRPRQAVASALTRAIKSISAREQDTNLANHLKERITYGKTLSYTADLKWET